MNISNEYYEILLSRSSRLAQIESSYIFLKENADVEASNSFKSACDKMEKRQKLYDDDFDSINSYSNRPIFRNKK